MICSEKEDNVLSSVLKIDEFEGAIICRCGEFGFSIAGLEYVVGDLTGHL